MKNGREGELAMSSNPRMSIWGRIRTATHVTLSADLLVTVVRLRKESERGLDDTTTKSKVGEKASSASGSRYAAPCCPKLSILRLVAHNGRS